MSTISSPERERVVRWPWAALGIGLLASAACIVGAIFDPAQFFRAWLASYVFYLGIVLGSLAVLLIYHLTGGAWGLLMRRILEAVTRTLPLMALLFVPIACGLAYLFLWAQPDVVRQSPMLQHQHRLYLNPPFFWARAAVYFLLWLGVAYLLNRWSREEDQTGNPRLAWKSMRFSAVAAVIYGLTMHFASVDWLLSLQSQFPSTIIGPLVVSGQMMSGHAFAILVLAWAVRRPPLSEVVSLKALNDVGSLLFSFLVIWAYMVWFQFMLVWIANLPDDVSWFLPRSRGGWLAVVWALFILHFAVPFFLLLARPVKRNPTAMAWIAGLILVMQCVFDYWQVLPAFHAGKVSQHWLDFVTPIAIGGLWFPCFVWQLGRRPLLPAHDYNRQEADLLRQSDEEEAAREEALAHD
jgi:hypothetical protein